MRFISSKNLNRFNQKKPHVKKRQSLDHDSTLRNQQSLNEDLPGMDMDLSTPNKNREDS